MSKTIKKSGFTLIELLIVIGLLAALAAVLLPTLMGDRETALAGLDKYNAAGTLRTLRQYETFTGYLPNGMHTGLEDPSTQDLMDVTDAFKENATATTSIVKLTALDVRLLSNIGITKLAYGPGNKSATDIDHILGYKTLEGGEYVVALTEDWKGEDGPITFNGKNYTALTAEGYTKIINLFLTPTAIWEATGKGWVKGFGVKMDVPGTCPIVDEEFSYYTVFIGIKAEGEAKVTASATGTSVPEPLPTQTTAGDLADMKAMVDDLETGTTLNGNGDWDAVWAEATDSSTGVVTATRVFNYDDTTNSITGTITYTITFAPEGSVTFLGTSCPEHGVTNP